MVLGGKKQGDKRRVVKRQGERLKKDKKGVDKGKVGERQRERLKKGKKVGRDMKRG